MTLKYFNDFTLQIVLYILFNQKKKKKLYDNSQNMSSWHTLQYILELKSLHLVFKFVH